MSDNGKGDTQRRALVADTAISRSWARTFERARKSLYDSAKLRADMDSKYGPLTRKARRNRPKVVQ